MLLNLNQELIDHKHKKKNNLYFRGFPAPDEKKIEDLQKEVTEYFEKNFGGIKSSAVKLNEKFKKYIAYVCFED